MLVAHLRLSRLLAEFDDPSLTPARRRRVEAAVAEEVTLLWQTDEVRSRRPRVVDEIRHGLWFFEQSLLRVAELLLADYRRLLPDAPAPFRFGTWIGGDLDGNPAAGAATIAEALDRARELALTTYASEVRELAGALGISGRLVSPPPELEASIAREEGALPDYAAELGDRNLDEPYRRKLSFVWRRLRNELEGRGEPGYATASDLAADLASSRSVSPGEPGHAYRRRPAGGAATPGRALRLPPGEARRSRARGRAARRLGAPR